MIVAIHTFEVRGVEWCLYLYRRFQAASTTHTPLARYHQIFACQVKYHIGLVESIHTLIKYIVVY